MRMAYFPYFKLLPQPLKLNLASYRILSPNHSLPILFNPSECLDTITSQSGLNIPKAKASLTPDKF